ATALQAAAFTKWEITRLEECLEPFELAVTAEIKNGDLKALKFAWNKSIFHEREITLLADYYVDLLQQISADPGRSLRNFKLSPGVPLPLLSVKAIEESAPCSIHAWIEEQCVRAPQKVAAVCGDKQITYAE